MLQILTVWRPPRTSSDLLSSPQTPPPNRPADFQIKTSGPSNVVVLTARKTPRTKEFKLLEQNKVISNAIPTHTQSKLLLALLIVNCRYLTDWLIDWCLCSCLKHIKSFFHLKLGKSPPLSPSSLSGPQTKEIPHPCPQLSLSHAHTYFLCCCRWDWNKGGRAGCVFRTPHLNVFCL